MLARMTFWLAAGGPAVLIAIGVAGTAMGQPLARAVVRLHGRDLLMRSQPGKGTTVIARFRPDRTMHHRSNDSRVADA